MTPLPVPRSTLGECPVWVADEAALYWTDIVGRAVHRYAPATGATRSWPVAEAVGSFARAADGGFVAATESGFQRLCLDGDEACLEPIAPVLGEGGGLRMNDGRCDRQGRFFAGSMAWTPVAGRAPGVIFRLARGIAMPVLAGFTVPNGIAWSPDGATMYAAETHRSVATVWAYDYDRVDGVPCNRRVFVDMRAHGGRPDGAAVDVDGGYWTAATDRGALLRFTPDGRLDRTIELPVRHPTMPAFGGPDLRQLFVTSLRGGDAGPDSPDGGLFVVDAGAAGMPEPVYAA